MGTYASRRRNAIRYGSFCTPSDIASQIGCTDMRSSQQPRSSVLPMAYEAIEPATLPT